ncbi:MAG: ABC transporter permease [Flavobacteriales bacterium]|nr:ABC transporter permease [Flavobacteriales bacterium]
MIRNYLLSALRNFGRNRLSTMLNIFGLSAGIASCLFIYLYVSDELSYDRSFSKADRIYRLQSFYKFDDVDDKFGITPFPAVPMILQDYAEVESGTRLLPNGQQFIKRDEQVFQVEEVNFADSNFFQVFDFPFVYGDPTQSLKEPKSMVLSLAESKRIFGDVDPVGKTLTWEPDVYKVTGVFDDTEIRTHMVLGMVASMHSLDTAFINQFSANWGNNNSYSYIVLPREGMADEFQGKLDQVVSTYQLPQWQTEGFNGTIEMHAEPLRDVHFNNYLIYDTPKKGNKNYVMIFSIVAILTLSIACINFVNLSTAAASKRAREVAMRKVAGASRKQLIVQFIGEALLMSLISCLLAFAMVELLMPFFNYITGKEITSAVLISPYFLGMALMMVLFIGLFAGSYPAFYISALPITSIFREARTALGKSGLMRRVLVTAQFTLSIAMIIATLSVLSQLHFMRNKDLGFKKDNMIVLTLPQADSTQRASLTALKNELMSTPGIVSVARSAHIPGRQTSRFVLNVNTTSGPQDKPFPVLFTDENYLTMSQMKLKEGRLFTAEDAARPFGVVLVNEAVVKSCGWTNPLAEKITIPGDVNAPPQQADVIGVISDFHFTSLHFPIEPLIIGQQNPAGVAGNLMVETDGTNNAQVLTAIEDAWTKSFPNKELDYSFMDDQFKKLYASEEKMFSISLYFAVLAILLCCLGLYGLSAFTTQQRTKEIGIRKVMGASVKNILTLLNRDFLLLVIVSIVLAFPLAWYGVTHWLQNFAYHEEVKWMYFLLAALFAILITMITVSVHAMQTALKDPVKALRYE